MPRAFLIKAKKEKKREDELGTQPEQFPSGIIAGKLRVKFNRLSMLAKILRLSSLHGFSSVWRNIIFFQGFESQPGIRLKHWHNLLKLVMLYQTFENSVKFCSSLFLSLIIWINTGKRQNYQISNSSTSPRQKKPETQDLYRIPNSSKILKVVCRISLSL